MGLPVYRILVAVGLIAVVGSVNSVAQAGVGTAWGRDQRAIKQAEQMLSGPIVSGGTNLCQRSDQSIEVMDVANFGSGGADGSFGPSYRLELKFEDSCLHYLAENGTDLKGKLPSYLQVKVLETLGRHEAQSGGLVDFLVKVGGEISWLGVKRPFQRAYLLYQSPRASCVGVRSLVGYYNRQAVVSLEEFNTLPAQQQVLTVIHEILRRVQVDMMGDLSLPTTMALEETAQALVTSHNQNLSQLPFFKIMSERLSQSPLIKGICKEALALNNVRAESKRQIQQLCQERAIISRLTSRGVSEWATQVRSIIQRDLRSNKSEPATSEGYQSLSDNLFYLESPGLWAGHVVPFAPATGAAAAAIRQTSVDRQFNIYSLNYEPSDREATCEVLKQLQW
ncbi:MAG: hypothetical protein IT288_17885 [Bdellovibrionales bacterium]|nr:hypothetical protein [Bdellovibrionales bacterium]